MDSGFAEALAYGFIYHRLQPAPVDRELRVLKTRIGAARLAPDLLADAVHVEQFVSPDPDLVESWKEPELGELFDRMRQRVDADAELAHAIGLLENLAIDATRMQHKGRCQPANAAADDDRLHNPRPTPTTVGIMRLAGRRSNPTALQQ